MIETVTLWLLVSIGAAGTPVRSVNVVERFASVIECNRVAGYIGTAPVPAPMLVCVQATVVR